MKLIQNQPIKLFDNIYIESNEDYTISQIHMLSCSRDSVYEYSVNEFFLRNHDVNKDKYDKGLEFVFTIVDGPGKELNDNIFIQLIPENEEDEKVLGIYKDHSKQFPLSGFYSRHEQWDKGSVVFTIIDYNKHISNLTTITLN